MWLLFVNSFKGLRKKKIQMAGIILMVLLSTGIYTAMTCALDRLEDRYNNYLKEQKVEEFSFTPIMDYSKDYTKEEIESLKQNELKDIKPEELAIINQYEMTIGLDNIPNSEMLYKGVDYILKSYKANEAKVAQKVDSIASNYDFNYEIEPTKLFSSGKYSYAIMEYDKDRKLNIPYLVKGRFPQTENEITLLPTFASKNNISIGDKYELNKHEYEVVGFAYASNYIYPMTSIASPIFNDKYNSVIFMGDSTYKAFEGLDLSSYIAKFNNQKLDDTQLEAMFKSTDDIKIDITSILRFARVRALSMEIDSDRTFANYFLYFLLSVAVIIILIISKKRIEDERLQIGVLKSLGYGRFKIAISYLVYPLVGSLIGGSLGFLIGILTHENLTNIYLGYFNLPINGYSFKFEYVFNAIILPTLLLSALTFVIAMVMLRHKPLYLLKEGSNLKVNFFSKVVSKLTRKLGFKDRFRYSLASRSLGKLSIVTLTSFCTGMLIVLVLIGVNLFSTMLEKSFAGYNFDYMVSYAKTQSGNSDTEDLALTFETKLKNIKKSDGTIVNPPKEDYSITVNGFDSDAKLINFKDEKGNNLLSKLDSNEGIIINKTLKEMAKIDVGDSLIYECNGNEYTDKVIGVMDQTTPNMIQRLSHLFVRKPLISIEI